MSEFLHHIKGNEMKEAIEWDHTRHIMFTVAKAAGSKKIKSVKDILSIPLLDKKDNPGVRPALLKRLEEFKKNGKST